ncbi:hypothetical protein ABZX63_17675 [Streptomyces tendae]|uniref:hypothetical protein n=1 Tax=Streptomyces tendae TaxID=1932 RepID=UPI0033B4FFD8
MSRTTPPRPFDVTALFPRLAPLARTATRLHPRPGSPSPHDSSVGGPLLWPAGEPWPHCPEPHPWEQVEAAFDLAEERADRGIPARTPHQDPEAHEAAEPAPDDLAGAGLPGPGGPIAMLPVAQLHARDVPRLRPPGRAGADLLQVLWCPFDHPATAHPRTALFWRSAAEVADVLDAPPEPPSVEYPGYLPQPCLLAPEEVVEYPHFMELDEELRQELADWSRWQVAAPDASYADAPQDLYVSALSVSPGWKAGGWSRWGLTDPVPRACAVCGTAMDPLLTVASTEWNSGSRSWAPEGEQARDPLPPGVPPANYTRIDLARGYDLQLHVCPVSADHPHLELIQ